MFLLFCGYTYITILFWIGSVILKWICCLSLFSTLGFMLERSLHVQTASCCSQSLPRRDFFLNFAYSIPLSLLMSHLSHLWRYFLLSFFWLDDNFFCKQIFHLMLMWLPWMRYIVGMVIASSIAVVFAEKWRNFLRNEYFWFTLVLQYDYLRHKIRNCRVKFNPDYYRNSILSLQNDFHKL